MCCPGVWAGSAFFRTPPMLSFLKNLLALRFMPRPWAMACFAALGVLGGVGLLVGHVSRATSYLSDAPGDVHELPRDGHAVRHLAAQQPRQRGDLQRLPRAARRRWSSKYAFKAQDGLWHATVFTMRWEPQVIRLSKKAVPVVEDNCRRCHAAVIDDVCLRRCIAPGDLRCWDCHREVPHGTVRSLSATPDVFQPRLPPVDADPENRRSADARRGREDVYLHARHPSQSLMRQARTLQRSDV